MTQEKLWEEMVETWCREVPGPHASHRDMLNTLQRSSRRVVWLAIFETAMAVAAVALLSAWAMLQAGVVAYTFAVIGWSAFLPIGSYVVAHRKDINADTLASTSMLDSHIRKQQAKRNLLEFTRVLLGVETIIASAFWIASNIRTNATAWQGGIAIALFGVLLTGLAWGQKKKTEATVQTLIELQGTLQGELAAEPPAPNR